MGELENKGRAAGKSAVWYTASSLLTKGLAFITIPIFTRIMTTGEFGLFNNFAAWQVILISVFSLEGYATLNRARLDIHGRELQNYQFTLLTSAMGLSALLGVLLFLFPAIPEYLTDLDSKYLYAMVLYLMFHPSFSMFQMLQRVQYRYKLSAGLTLASSLVATGCSVALVVLLPDALMGRIVGQYGPYILLGMAFYLWYWKSGGTFRVSYLKYALPLFVPLIVAALGSQILLLGCRIVVQHTCGSDQVAYLSLATSLTQIALILIGSINNAWAPWMYDCLEHGEPGRARRFFERYLWGIVALCFAVSIFAPELVWVLGGDGYRDALPIVPSFMTMCAFSMLPNQYIYLETYHKDAGFGGIATLVFGLVNVPLSWLAVVAFGFEGVGYASIASNILLIAAHKVLLRKKGIEDIFATKRTVLALVAALASIPLCLVCYTAFPAFVRYVIVAALAVCGGAVVWKNRAAVVAKLRRRR